MATKLGQLDSRAVTRETKLVSRGRPVIIRLEANGSWIAFREKGTRLWYRVPVQKAFWEAIKLYAAERKAAKQAERLARRKAKK